MHFGTNDVWNNKAPSEIQNAYTAVLNKLRTQNPNVIVLVAQIIPMNPSGCSQCNMRVQALNATIPSWANSHTQSNSPILVVDQYTGFDLAWTTDGVHPNATNGSQAMADK